MFDSLSEKLSDAFRSLRGKSQISEENIEGALKNVRTALLEADVNFKVVKAFIQNVKEKALGEKVIRGVDPEQQFIKIIHDELTALMGGEEKPFEARGSVNNPTVILVVGLNGAGKTTFSGKLALFLRKNNHQNVLLVPADTYRPAAKDQLEIHAKNMGIALYQSDLTRSPREIAFSALQYAKNNSHTSIIIDTAGRLHVDETLMSELKDLKNAITGWSPEVILVADAMTGQEAVSVAETFHQAVGLTGVALSKMDSDARGGAALSIRYATGVPIRFMSVGEKMKDLETFHPDRLSQRILDMGDVLTLVEKAQEVIDEKESEKLLKNLEEKKYSIEDFLSQMNTMSKLGSISSLMKMIPGMGGLMRQMGDLSPAENEMTKMKVLIGSMTKNERKDYKLMKVPSRAQRVAKGSGHKVQDVKQFIEKFEMMRNMMFSMSGFMGGASDKGGAQGKKDLKMPNPMELMEQMMGGGGARGGHERKGFRTPPKSELKNLGQNPFGNFSGSDQGPGQKKKSPFGKKYF